MVLIQCQYSICDYIITPKNVFSNVDAFIYPLMAIIYKKIQWKGKKLPYGIKNPWTCILITTLK